MPENEYEINNVSPLHETAAHLWKDLKVVRSNSVILILLVVIACFSCISIYSIALDYEREVSNDGGQLAAGEIEELQNTCIFEFWSGTLTIIWPLTFGLLGALLISQENEDGLVKYNFTYGSHSIPVYLSKFASLSILTIAAYLMFILFFQLIFYFASGDMVDFVILAYASAFPMAGLVLIGMIGLLLASVVNKRYSAFIALLMFVFISYSLSNLVWSEGINAFDLSTGGPYEFLTVNKIVYLLDPMTLKQGMLDVLGLCNTEDVFYQNYYQVVDGASRAIYAFSAFIALSIMNVYVLHRKHRSNS